ncbi:MAG: DNA (cytosine-5-)-methyltransferase, partial [Acidobacteria bacterium]|nr:DNA (cytosine-5-)-methyltransferase [Acidobacteriota bacterium]
MTERDHCGSAVGLFAGIGGLELGLHKAGFESVLLAENFEPAAAVLNARFPNAELVGDVRGLKRLPRNTEIVVGGFPCQDLSSVGPKSGISGTRSSLVGEIFRLLSDQPVPWVVLENVPFLLDLDRGRALRLVTSALEELGYTWAYRVLDAQCFGIPQRRRRWFLVASLVGDPRAVLLSRDQPSPPAAEPTCFGFYWTEGTRALGWAPNVIPPLKCGSTIGVPSPPAIFTSHRSIVTPDLRDAERLQGFRVDWTKPAELVAKQSIRWKLVGNAVSVKVAEWVAARIAQPTGTYDYSRDTQIEPDGKWPRAAWGGG